MPSAVTGRLLAGLEPLSRKAIVRSCAGGPFSAVRRLRYERDGAHWVRRCHRVRRVDQIRPDVPPPTPDFSFCGAIW